MTKTISLTVWKEQAKEIEDKLGIRMVGDKAEIVAKVKFEVRPAAGRRKVLISFELRGAVECDSNYCESNEKGFCTANICLSSDTKRISSGNLYCQTYKCRK